MFESSRDARTRGGVKDDDSKPINENIALARVHNAGTSCREIVSSTAVTVIGVITLLPGFNCYSISRRKHDKTVIKPCVIDLRGLRLAAYKSTP